jgi:hypothetical protein
MAMMATPKCESYYSPVEDEKAKLQAQLNNCASWYDGCNDCVVKDGNILGCTKMYCEKKSKPYCKEKIEVKPDINLKNCA